MGGSFLKQLVLSMWKQMENIIVHHYGKNKRQRVMTLMLHTIHTKKVAQKVWKYEKNHTYLWLFFVFYKNNCHIVFVKSWKCYFSSNITQLYVKILSTIVFMIKNIISYGLNVVTWTLNGLFYVSYLSFLERAHRNYVGMGRT